MEQNSISLSPVNSKTVTQMGYDATTKTMYVQFASGAIYSYADTSEYEYRSIREDDSVGSKLRRVVAEKLHAKLSVESDEFKRLKY